MNTYQFQRELRIFQWKKARAGLAIDWSHAYGVTAVLIAILEKSKACFLGSQNSCQLPITNSSHSLLIQYSTILRSRKLASGGSHLKIEISQKWHQEVQFFGRFLGPAKIDHQKLAIRKKSTFLRFSTPNFDTQLVIPVSLHKKNLAIIG